MHIAPASSRPTSELLVQCTILCLFGTEKDIETKMFFSDIMMYS